jgi:hypothetical protein
MAEIQRLEQLEDIVAHIVVDKPRVERPEIGVVDVLKHQRGGFALAVPHHVQQCHNVGTSREVL